MPSLLDPEPQNQQIQEAEIPAPAIPEPPVQAPVPIAIPEPEPIPVSEPEPEPVVLKEPEKDLFDDVMAGIPEPHPQPPIEPEQPKAMALIEEEPARPPSPVHSEPAPPSPIESNHDDDDFEALIASKPISAPPKVFKTYLCKYSGLLMNVFPTLGGGSTKS